MRECLSSSKVYYAYIAAHEYVHKYQESSMHTDRHADVLSKYYKLTHAHTNTPAHTLELR